MSWEPPRWLRETGAILIALFIVTMLYVWVSEIGLVH